MKLFLLKKRKIISGSIVLILILVIVLAVRGGRQLPNLDRFSLFQPKLTAVKVSFGIPEFKAKIALQSKSRLDRWQQLIEESIAVPGTVDPREKYWLISLRYSNEAEHILVATKELKIFDPGRQVGLDNVALEAEVDYLTDSLEKDFFGAPLAWEEVNTLFPRKTRAEVRDLETGLTFQVFRFGGTNHTDVEPVTFTDKQILQQIYGGEWSWKRRAVVVTAGGRQIAASMNGMPHGDGDIGNNEFKGHFCIHFAGSRVHKTGQVDPGHQLMVNKAGGMLWETIVEADPTQFVKLLMAGIANGDIVTARYGVEKMNLPQLWSRLAREIRFMDIGQIKEISADEGQAQVEVDLTVYYYKPFQGQGYKKVMLLNLVKPDPGLGWQANLEELAFMLDRTEGEITEPALSDIVWEIMAECD